MEGSLELVLRGNGNPLTKAAYLEIVRLLDKEEKAEKLRDLVSTVCLEDLRSGSNSSVGWQLYLEQATSILLKTITEDHKESAAILELLLQNENEEVVLKTLLWMNKSDYPSDNVKHMLYELVCQDKWDGVCALALRAMSSVTDKSEISLEECIRGLERSGVLPVTEGWITVAGYAARTVSSLNSDLIVGICESDRRGIVTEVHCNPLRYFSIFETGIYSTCRFTITPNILTSSYSRFTKIHHIQSVDTSFLYPFSFPFRRRQ